MKNLLLAAALFLTAVSAPLTAQAAPLWGTVTVCVREDYKLIIKEKTGLFGGSKLILKENRNWTRALLSESAEREMVAFGPEVDTQTLPTLLQRALKDHPLTAERGGEALVLESESLVFVELSTLWDATLKGKERSTVYLQEKNSGMLMKFDVETHCLSQ
jgi:hypothetical protein